MTENGNRKLVVLIDADNAQASICTELLAEIAKFGIASIKRAYPPIPFSNRAVLLASTLNESTCKRTI
jgi:hypothetical protein